MMAQAEADEIFVYMGGDQEVPWGVRRARIHKSVKTVPYRAFYCRSQLIDVEFHDEIEIIGKEAFSGCSSLRKAKLLGIKIIKEKAFYECIELTDVEFCDELETIGNRAFYKCTSLKKMTMPSIRTIGERAFYCCLDVSNVECGEGLETIARDAFNGCTSLSRIALPLKDDMIADSISVEGGGIIINDAFCFCVSLNSVDLVGGIHNTVASLHLDSWKIEMTDIINRISQVLSNNTPQKTTEIKQWLRSVISRLDHYKAEHNALLKEATTLLELALWKVNLGDKEGGALEIEGVRTTSGRRKRARKEICVTSGASIVIKNVLPFLQLE